MANDFSRQVRILFDEMIEAYNANNVMARHTPKYKMEGRELQRSQGQTTYKSVPVIKKSVDGRDVTSATETTIERLSIPITLNGDDHLRNVLLDLDGIEALDESNVKEYGRSKAVELSSRVDTLITDAIVNNGTLVVTNPGNISTYEDVAEIKSLMDEQEVPMDERYVMFNTRTASRVIGNLGGRQTMTGIPEDAYTRAIMPTIADMMCFSTSYSKAVTGSAGTGYLVNGANQDYTPSAMTGNVPTDNRTQTLTVDTGTGAAVGDCFTIAGTNAVGHINKEDTTELKTFRIKAINGNDWTISPPIIPADGTAEVQKNYANVTTTPADNAAITILNTQTAKATTFFRKGAIQLLHSDWNLDPFRANNNVITSATTDDGLKISLLQDSEAKTLGTSYRSFIWCNPEVENVEQCGIALDNQS